MDHDIFISYAQKAPEPTVALADELVRRGFRPWYDVNLLPGDYFGAVIDQAIDRAKAVVTIWTPPALTSKWVPAESERAQSQGKLICIRTEDVDARTLPTPFNRMHVPLWTDFDGLAHALFGKGVRPAGIGDVANDLDKLMEDAQRSWRLVPRDDAEAIEAFLEVFGHVAMFRVMARKRLDALVATGRPSLRPTPPPQPPLPKPEDVILRLNPEMHTAINRRISVSADGRLLATASEDKTVKLWRLPEGKLLHTLRPPIGPGDEGKVYAVALDPAGRWVAVGGWDKDANPQNLACFVTLFDATNGAVRARLGPLPNAVLDLAVSPDGSRLAAGLGDHGLRVWDTTRALDQAPPLVFEDRDFGGDVYGLAFGPAGTPAAGRLAATSYDGHVRLYAAEGKLLVKAKAPSGERPYGIGFSPDGRLLAVGYDDALRVDLLDAATLRSLSSVDVTGLTGGTLSSVAFLNPASPGAAPCLAAGGMRTNEGRLFVWADAGRGSRSVWPGPENTVMDLAPLPEGALALGAFDPAFGVINAAGERTLFQGPTTADLRNKLREHFTVSADGRRLRFGLKQGSGTPVLFDLANRQLTDAPKPLAGLAPANTDRLRLTPWENNTAPQLDGKPLAIEAYEMARSLAIAPDAGSFVLGTEWLLRRYDAKGTSLWEHPVPGVVWGVNLAREGRLIIAAYGDGTIRWHRAQDGKELLALFIHLPKGPDGPREWILFTPEGYYEASSTAAESLLGWHVNRGPDEAADFYPVETFASVYKRPDRIAAALDGI